jgi:threo-3-hydroxy-L-aspartate ammonia-lyase
VNDRPLPLSAADVFAAQYRLRTAAVRTPALSHPALDRLCGRPVTCKAESLQRTGSFKFRGAYNALASLTAGERRRGVIGASSGNHAQALAVAGALMSAPVTVVVPHDAPRAKVSGARTAGAEVITYRRHDQDREQIVTDLAERHGYTIIPSSDSAAVMAGAGTAAAELLTQAPGLTAIVVPVGGGGLAAGTAIAAKQLSPAIRIIGAEPRDAADTAASLRAGHRVRLATAPATIADGLRHLEPYPLPWEVNRQLLDEVVTVTDDEIIQAMTWAFEYLKIIAEPSGAVALAAVPALPGSGDPTGVIISGGSIDIDIFARLLSGTRGKREVLARP